MGFFKRDRGVEVQVRVLEAGPWQLTQRKQAGGGTWKYKVPMKVEVVGDGIGPTTVELDAWIPREFSLANLVRSGRVLRGRAAQDDPGGVEIEWPQLEEDMTPQQLAMLFHKQGPARDRLALLESLHAKGHFEEDRFASSRAELLAEIGPA